MHFQGRLNPNTAKICLSLERSYLNLTGVCRSESKILLLNHRIALFGWGLAQGIHRIYEAVEYRARAGFFSSVELILKVFVTLDPIIVLLCKKFRWRYLLELKTKLLLGLNLLFEICRFEIKNLLQFLNCDARFASVLLEIKRRLRPDVSERVRSLRLLNLIMLMIALSALWQNWRLCLFL